MSVGKDFHPITGVLVDSDEARAAEQMLRDSALPRPTAAVFPAPAAPDHPLGIAPTGSAAGKVNGKDFLRTLVASFSLYGVAQAAVHFLAFAGFVAPALVPKYAPEIVGFTVAATTLLTSWMTDNTPRTP